ncbi:Zn-dependent hydrolase [Roseomonas sp. NAR14]|uniref:Zn-dependent hydrolase n=1 Tax=Roseomonas acroporae TaxID=2937791 RepID=A0A9X2BYG5_9PROT|nr:Zn-dependent hydrolase [Roseomonas acroporae]MCK8785985.1 Zn-dependent hydrolase [Roseomonas acroporae]
MTADRTGAAPAVPGATTSSAPGVTMPPAPGGAAAAAPVSGPAPGSTEAPPWLGEAAAASRALAEELFDALRRAGDDGVGITRDSYGAGESAALDLVEAAARRHGLETARDAGANLVVTLPGSDPALPALACGSHLDSVPQGGNFDGAAGVIAGLMALARLRAEGFAPRRAIRLYALRGEESAAFGRAYMGSSALFGQLSPADLALPHAVTGRTLRDCMAEAGADVARIGRGEALLDPASLSAWLELHIEQGPVLVARRLPVSVVTGIRGNVRHRSVTCLGEAGHSGAVPRWLRHDAVFAAADLLHRLDGHWQAMLGQGHDLVVTTGVLGTDPAEHAIARIPGRLRFSFEARSQSQATLEAFHALFVEECGRVEAERGVRFAAERRLDTAPAVMDPGWIGRLRGIVRRLGLPDEPMASGAGHDAAVFSNAGVPSVMLFVRNENGSHNPREAMEMEDFMAGAEVLRLALTEGAA